MYVLDLFVTTQRADYQNQVCRVTMEQAEVVKSGDLKRERVVDDDDW